MSHADASSALLDTAQWSRDTPQLNGAGTLHALRLPSEGVVAQAWPRDITAIGKGHAGLDEETSREKRYQLAEDMKVGPLFTSPSISGKF